jgi:hypothetical protein
MQAVHNLTYLLKFQNRSDVILIAAYPFAYMFSRFLIMAKSAHTSGQFLGDS